MADNATTITAAIARYRQEPLRGRIVDLVPYIADHHARVVELRNSPKACYFLHKETALTLAMQRQWYADYLRRSDDLYWVVAAKSGQIIGTNRIYDISADQLEKGSLVIDEEFARGAPYALESDLLAMRFAFDVLRVQRIITAVRADNAKMQSMNARFGFRQTGERLVRGVSYPVYELEHGDFEPRPFASIIDYWSTRREH